MFFKIINRDFRGIAPFQLQRPLRNEMPNLIPPVAMHRRRRPQPVTMEADAEAAFPAPPDDAMTPTKDLMTSQPQQRRRRPIRGDHETNMEVMFNHVTEEPAPYPRTRSGSRDITGDPSVPKPTRQRPLRSDGNNMQQQQQQQTSTTLQQLKAQSLQQLKAQSLQQQQHNVSQLQQQQYSGNNINSVFLKNRARFNSKYSGQDDDAKMMARQRTTRSHSQPAVHHLHHLTNGDLQPAGSSNRQLQHGDQQRAVFEVSI